MKLRRTVIGGLALAASLALGACGGAVPAATPSAAPNASVLAALPATVSVSDAAGLRDGGAFVLDVREPDEWAAGHIPDATLIPLGQLASRVAEVPADRTIVVVCRSGNRSAQGRDVLFGAGLVAVTSMAGGMNDWTAAGLPVATGS
ncbi:MAG TPA: rhodanese-like domain-containing protein [Candidatus Limnocylindrales bacterium]|nr:rhodanese-like domain-containing protein [Candidatus Limnocylindrales bacterium]